MRTSGKLRGSPLAFPPSDSQGSGLGLESSPNQIGAESRRENQTMKGFGDIAMSRPELAVLAPTQNRTRLAGPALQGLRRAAGI